MWDERVDCRVDYFFMIQPNITVIWQSSSNTIILKINNEVETFKLNAGLNQWELRAENLNQQNIWED